MARYVFTRKALEMLKRHGLKKSDVVTALHGKSLLHSNVPGALHSFVYFPDRVLLVGAVHKKKPNYHLIISCWAKDH